MSMVVLLMKVSLEMVLSWVPLMRCSPPCRSVV